jgi:hypothetical protein
VPEEKIDDNRISDQIERFSNRALTFLWQAYGCLIVIILLIGFGGLVFYSASTIAATDIGRRSLEEQLTRVQALSAEKNQELQKIDGERAKMNAEIAEKEHMLSLLVDRRVRGRPLPLFSTKQRSASWDIPC